MASQILPSFRTLTWRIPPPPAPPPAYSHPGTERLRQEAWPSDTASPQPGPLLRYAGALLRQPAFGAKREYALAMHALAHYYDQLVHEPELDDSEGSAKADVALAGLRAAQLAHAAYLNAGLPAPWPAEMHQLLEAHARILSSWPEASNPSFLGSFALGAAEHYRQWLAASEPSLVAYARAGEGFWRAAALVGLAPGLPTLVDQNSYSAHYIAEQHQLRVRHHAAAEQVLSDISRHLKSHSALRDPIKAQLARTAELAQGAVQARDKHAASRGDYSSQLVDPTSLLPLSLASPVPLAELAAPTTTDARFQLDGRLLAEADAFGASAPTTTAAGKKTNPGDSSINSLMGDLSMVSEADLVRSGLVHTLKERRALLLGALVERHRHYANGLLGVRDPATVQALDTAIRELTGTAAISLSSAVGLDAVPFPTIMASTDTLVWAAREVTAALLNNQPRHVGLPQRLHTLIKETRSAPRAFLEDKVLSPISRRVTSSTTGSPPDAVPGVTVPNMPPLPIVPPTAKELSSAGISLARLRQLDGALTPKVLLGMGVIHHWDDLKLLGVATFSDFLDQVGQPRDVAKWLRSATGSDTAWKVNFLRPLAFSPALWLEHRDRLHPLDLCALDFHLGANLASQPTLYDTAKSSAPQWLGRAYPEEWIYTNQLTEGDYYSLLGQKPSASFASSGTTTTVSRSPGLMNAPFVFKQ